MTELPLDVVQFNFQTELEHAKKRAQVYGFKLEGDAQALTLRAEFVAADEETYILVGKFDDYRLKPPVLDFEEPVLPLSFLLDTSLPRPDARCHARAPIGETP